MMMMMMMMTMMKMKKRGVAERESALTACQTLSKMLSSLFYSSAQRLGFGRGGVRRFWFVAIVLLFNLHWRGEFDKGLSAS